MIELIKVNKSFHGKKIISDLTLNVNDGEILGILGSDGSGKSTLLRLISGIYHSDSGYLKVGGIPIYENNSLKNEIVLVSEQAYFLPLSTLAEMRRFYKIYYSNFDDKTYHRLLDIFPIKENSELRKFSQGKKRLASLILALSIKTKYLLLDETFQGLDPSISLNLKKMLKDNAKNNTQTIIVCSNNLNELQDLCDKVVLINDGNISLDLINHKFKNTHKFQLAFDFEVSEADFKELNILSYKTEGQIIKILVGGKLSTIQNQLKKLNPLILNQQELNLEEKYIYQESEDHNEKK